MVRAAPGILGLDEGTGVVVQGGAMQATGPGRVLVHDRADHGAASLWRTRATDRFDLAT